LKIEDAFSNTTFPFPQLPHPGVLLSHPAVIAPAKGKKERKSDPRTHALLKLVANIIRPPEQKTESKTVC